MSELAEILADDDTFTSVKNAETCREIFKRFQNLGDAIKNPADSNIPEEPEDPDTLPTGGYWWRYEATVTVHQAVVLVTNYYSKKVRHHSGAFLFVSLYTTIFISCYTGVDHEFTPSLSLIIIIKRFGCTYFTTGSRFTC